MVLLCSARHCRSQAGSFRLADVAIIRLSDIGPSRAIECGEQYERHVEHEVLSLNIKTTD